MNRSSKNRLTEKETILFPSDTLFDKIGRAVCHANCLPRKELYEAWEVARRVRRRFRGGRVVDPRLRGRPQECRIHRWGSPMPTRQHR